MQLLIFRVFGSCQAKLSAVQYQFDPLRSAQEPQDGLFALTALRFRALSLVALYLDACRQVLSHKRSHGPEKDTNQGEDCASRNSIHDVQPGRWLPSRDGDS
ncbi:hypothetical protein ADL28_11565 [Streptomyces violaceusniger]|uniref:Uncharacterized protein n=1 Tax=Streptomyces violaceusniger TaxID=68280 RepID=A0A0X3X1L0_STRVO|nr:hypothetical protein ADL28_11565 [Streptomyces violaceusniger]